MGRPRCADVPIFRAYLANNCFPIDKNNFLRQRPLGDNNLRRICGFRKVPSEATFSRRLVDFARKNLPAKSLAELDTACGWGRKKSSQDNS